MSRLQPSQTPGSPATKIPVKVVKNAEKKVVAAEYQACDRCGYSEIDNQSIARAQVEVEVGNSTVSLCDHHFYVYTAHILEHNYEFRRLV